MISVQWISDITHAKMICRFNNIVNIQNISLACLKALCKTFLSVLPFSAGLSSVSVISCLHFSRPLSRTASLSARAAEPVLAIIVTIFVTFRLPRFITCLGARRSTGLRSVRFGVSLGTLWKK